MAMLWQWVHFLYADFFASLTLIVIVVGHVFRKCRCLRCSRRHRSIVSNARDAGVVKWFNNLAYTEPEEYRCLGLGLALVLLQFVLAFLQCPFQQQDWTATLHQQTVELDNAPLPRKVMSSHEDKVELRRGTRSKGKFDLHEPLVFTVTSHDCHCHSLCIQSSSQPSMSSIVNVKCQCRTLHFIHFIHSFIYEWWMGWCQRAGTKKKLRPRRSSELAQIGKRCAGASTRPISCMMIVVMTSLLRHSPLRHGCETFKASTTWSLSRALCITARREKTKRDNMCGSTPP